METSTEFEYPLIEVIRKRRSRRAYSSQPVEPDKIRSLFEAARWAPSSMNDQPWHYIYGVKGESDMWDVLFGLLNEGNKPWAKEAPLLILSFARNHFLLNGRPNTAAKHDLGGANVLLSLQATALDLNVHQIGGYDHERAHKELNIPDGYDLGTMLAIGYYGDPGKLSETHRQRELAPRRRNRQSEFVMTGTFEEKH